MNPVDLDKHPSFALLKELAQAPFNFASSRVVAADRIKKYVSSMAGFDLLYSTQRIDDDVLDALQALADECRVTEQFKTMKSGAVMNRIEGFDSENRQVLHTATRDVFSDSPAEPNAAGQAVKELQKLRLFLADLQSGAIVNKNGEAFTDMVQVGIGGSDLGPRALYHALSAFKISGRRVHFISNVDPDDAASVLKGLDLSRTLVNVVSKSGSTLETLTNEELVREAYKREGLEPQQHFVAVTGEGSPMDNPESYLRSFYMFDYIGGRYSATSMVGGVMLGFALGYQGVEDILRGAAEVDAAAEEKDIRKNIPLLMALLGVWNHNFLNCETVAVLPYSQGLIRFTAHLQQCDMESNGKSINRQGADLSYQSGPIVWGEPGTNGQHAFYQLIHQGTTVIPVEFIGFRKSQYDNDILIKETSSQEKLLANLLAQSLALATGQEHENPNKRFPGNRPNSVLMADRLTPGSMGALLALYEAKIAFQGFLWNINSFDQEGVQLGKKLANQLLDHFAARRKDNTYDGNVPDGSGWALLQASGALKR
ncbi:MAG: glucose-6-phosphate isomerase [Desulfobulbaceae bacterium]|nr:glucose-6-phosphate isomerase [Desulfobulbaceae bacterium]